MIASVISAGAVGIILGVIAGIGFGWQARARLDTTTCHGRNGR
ncbi:hypothetical protein ACLBXM_17800 [Xanthobacteraceae bacterium A53D]